MISSSYKRRAYAMRAGFGFTLVELMIVVLVIATVLAIALPNYLKMSSVTKKNVCINNLRKIDEAVDQWAIDYEIQDGVQPSSAQEEEIYNYIKGRRPQCPSGGTYTIYAVGAGSQVRCSHEDEGHKLIE